jgi:hypothetical protein
VTTHTAKGWVIRHRATGQFAYEDDAGDIAYGAWAPDTLTFPRTDEADDEKLLSTMSACPGGHEEVEQVPVTVTVTIEE